MHHMIFIMEVSMKSSRTATYGPCGEIIFFCILSSFFILFCTALLFLNVTEWKARLFNVLWPVTDCFIECHVCPPILYILRDSRGCSSHYR